MHRAIALIGMAAFLVLTGCAGAPRRATPNGAAVFADNCSSCHSLIGSESEHKTGGDLVGYSFSRSVLFQYASEMPTPHRLTRAELQAVVDYVRRAEGGAARRR
jgi:mono/diheme cytochrome c family protein